MTRKVGTVAMGIRAPIIKAGDDLESIVVDSVMKAARTENFEIKDRDVIGITESLLARAQGNYATIEQISAEFNNKFDRDLAVVFPILSRNRFSMVLKAIAETGKRVYLYLSYPSDEVGNCLIDVDRMEEVGINPYSHTMDEEEYRRLFGEKVTHPFTGIDYVREYKALAKDGNMEIFLTNDAREALRYTDSVLVANVHERIRTKRILLNAGAKTIYCLNDILNRPIDGSGYNPDFGLLGSNKATETKIKLFPKDCGNFVNGIQKKMAELTGKTVEVMIYGDGAFKDPVEKIWELADPVVSPGYTGGLLGTPREIKLKYIADSELGTDYSNLDEEIKDRIRHKDCSGAETIGTTPRNITDLLGSLCDLVSGSGDKGTPIVLVQGYFDNYASD